LNSAATDADIKALENVANEYAAKWKDLDDAPLLFLYGKDSPMAGRVKTFTNLSDNALIILALPDGVKFVHEGHDFSEQAIRKFVEGFLAKTLKSKGVKE